MTAITIDRDLGLPVRQQIRAAFVDRICSGLLGVGAPLPSVRDLARSIGVAPMTVSKAYADLKAGGLVETRAGSGTFVAGSALARLGAAGELDAVLAEVDAVVDRIAGADVAAADAMGLLTSRAIRRLTSGRRPSFVLVGLFHSATESYASRIAEQIGAGASVTSMVLSADASHDGADAAARLRAADLIITFASLHARVAAVAPDTPIVSVRFIPAESTRMALAALDPMARVAVVSRFADFLPVLELGVRRFAPHVASVTALPMASLDLPQVVAGCDAVVMSTGAEAAGDLAPAEAVRFEYRHIPDPGDVVRLVLPRLAARATLASDEPLRDDEKEAS